MTLDEFLKAFTDKETESVSDAISVRVSDAEVYSLGRLFIQLMGGMAQCLRRPPRRLRHRRASLKKEARASDPLLTDLTEERTDDEDDLIH
jgi:hypothetical protein